MAMHCPFLYRFSGLALVPFVLGTLVGLAGCTQTPVKTQEPSGPVRPTRLIVLVVDGLGSNDIDRYDLKRFKALAGRGLQFKNAYVGHLTATTPVSHAVIATGSYPRRLPWQDRILSHRGKLVAWSSLKLTDLNLLLLGTSGNSLAKRLHDVSKGEPVFGIGIDPAATAALAGPFADALIALGPMASQAPLKGLCAPTGWHVPDYLSRPSAGRFYVDCRPTASTTDPVPAALEGNRYVEGRDPAHRGGDRWVVDAAIEIMQRRKDWRAMFLSFDSLSKVQTWTGDPDKGPLPAWVKEGKFARSEMARAADDALGTLLDALHVQGLERQTAIIVTSGFGTQRDEHYFGSGKPTRPKSDPEISLPFHADSLPVSLPVAKDPRGQRIEAVVKDSAIRFWLSQKDAVSVAKLANQVRNLPGIAEIYTKQVTGKTAHYIRIFRHPDLTGRALEWALRYHPHLVEAMAAPAAPEILALLLDGQGYGTPLDHGGAQENVQRIPWIVAAPNIKSGTSEAPVTLVDVAPMAWKILGLQENAGWDGTASDIEPSLLEIPGATP